MPRLSPLPSARREFATADGPVVRVRRQLQLEILRAQIRAHRSEIVRHRQHQVAAQLDVDDLGQVFRRLCVLKSSDTDSIKSPHNMLDVDDLGLVFRRPLRSPCGPDTRR